MKDNRGISLVELLIAVAILGILTIPLFTTFVNSAQINQDAIRVQNESALAQSIIEDIKASSLETLHIPAASTSTVVSKYPIPTVNDNLTAYGALTDAEKAIVDQNLEGYKSYTYEMTNLQAGTGRLYDAIVTLDPITYSNTDLALPDASNINLIELPTLPEIDVAKSAVISDQLKAYDYDDFPRKTPIENRFIALFGDAGVTSADQLVSDMKKSMVITIAAETNNRALITCDITYKNETYYPGKEVVINAYQNYYALNTGLGHDPSDESIEGEMSVYVFWDPSSYDGDEIIINNTTSTRVDVYLLREEDDVDEDTSGDSVTVTVGGVAYNTTNGDGRACNGNINLKTNIGNNAVSYDSAASTRCYEVTVTLYAAGELGTGEVITEVISTKEVYAWN